MVHLHRIYWARTFLANDKGSTGQSVHAPRTTVRIHWYTMSRRATINLTIRSLALLLLLLLLVACASSPKESETTSQSVSSSVTAAPDGAASSAEDGVGGSCSLDVPVDMAEEERIQAVLHAEGQFIVAQDIDNLMRLWDDDSQIADAKNTPDSSDDDQVWNGKDAIRHRYVRIVFPGAPATIQPTDLQININGRAATISATTQIDSEVSPAGDRWQLINRDDCWTIQRLTYNLEPK